MDEKVNWNTELRKIERQFDGKLPEPTAEELSTRRAADQQALQLRQNRHAVLGVWARLVLVGVLTGAVMFWPYSRACGFGLYSYMGAGVVIVVGGLWVSIYGWRFHIPAVHALALAMVLWGAVLITAQVLPRNGYAKVDPNHPPRWSCKQVPARASP